MPIELATLTLDDAEPRLAGARLSAWFDPFLSRFARETIGSRGEAVIAYDSRAVVGLLLKDPGERTASIFASTRAVAEELARTVPEGAVYAEVDLGGSPERFRIFAVELGEAPAHRFRHAPRLLSDDETAEVGALLSEVYGTPAEDWLAVASAEGERCFGVKVGEELVGVAWAQVAGRSARLHTLTVRPGFRELGIGTDLVFARLWFAFRSGADRAVSEISERNARSAALAARAGMRPVGEMFLHPGPSSRAPSVGPVARLAAGVATSG